MKGCCAGAAQKNEGNSGPQERSQGVNEHRMKMEDMKNTVWQRYYCMWTLETQIPALVHAQNKRLVMQLE